LISDLLFRFLWVDWQLRELCKLLRESDIRARLGKLPKGLTGVYDEIIRSIKSQPQCNFDLAVCALKWMLVSERPLTPAELVAAAELNPSLPVDSSSPSQESSLPVELLIQSCEGLLLLDTTLHVVRFSHLSVQEYLETRNGIWDIGLVDAELFVSEACLYLLQQPHSQTSPLYRYAALNWFKHCRSYQDLVLSTVNTKDANYPPSILLLDTFLGSFKQASTSYIKWAAWAHDLTEANASGLICIYSTPLCPAYSAAFAGLGELVSWLWDTKENDMKAKNDRGDSLLGVACRHGTPWIVVEILKQGFEINDIQNALYPASEGGNSSTVKLLLDQGADTNLPGGQFGSPLGAAVYWGRLETARLLLHRGADVNLTGGQYGTALGAAVYQGNLEVATLLLDQGADVNRIDPHHGSAVAAAVYWDRLDVITLLLDRGADINLPGGDHGTPLGTAAYRGSLEIVTLLLDRGANVNLPGGDHGSALAAATYLGRLDVITLLLDRGADANLSGGDLGSALGTAAFWGRVEIVKLLLNRGADVNLTGGRFGTALGAVAYGGSLEVVTLLLDQGANPNLANNQGVRPRDLAEEAGYPAIVSLLDSKCRERKAEKSTDSVCLPASDVGSS